MPGFGLQFRELKLNEALREVCGGWAGCRFVSGHTYRFRFTGRCSPGWTTSTRACSARPPRRRDLAHVVVGSVMG